jgi:hypothetical protein
MRGYFLAVFFGFLTSFFWELFPFAIYVKYITW